MSSSESGTRSSWFQRYLLPGFALKAVIIGGGYATGRELAEFFLPSGPWGGLAAMVLAMLIWSVVAAVTFVFARTFDAHDYRTFFKALLGRAWWLFEIAYLLSIVVTLAVFGAAAGELAKSALGVPPLVGTLTLMIGIGVFAGLGNRSVEALFKWVSFLLYGVYAIFLLFALVAFGDLIGPGFSKPASPDNWAGNGLAYAGYNISGAVIILPVLRHLTSRRDAVVAGLIAGPLAMAPAIIFFVCMVAFYPGIASEILPSDFLLNRLGSPAFHLLFQIMIFAALLECGVGTVHAVNERIANALTARHGAGLSHVARLLIALGLLTGCILVADQVGLVSLISNGYRALSYVILAVYVLPLLTIGLWLLRKGHGQASVSAQDWQV